MTNWTFQVDSYRVDLARQDLPQAGVKIESAVISCISAPRPGTALRKLMAHFWVGGEDKLHGNETISMANGVFGHVHLPIECYAAWLDLLRNEGPLQATISDDNARANALCSGREPAGSGDGD